MTQQAVASDRRRLPRAMPGQLTVALAFVAMAVAWLLVAGGLVGTVARLSELGTAAVVPLAVMGGAAVPAIMTTRLVLRFWRVCARVPAKLLRQRRYGDLNAVTGDERRSLRPVGMSVVDAVTRTDALLGNLMEFPGVRIFKGVRPRGSARPVASHGVSAGRLLVLVESVAWPPGRYRLDATGRVRCDGRYIGQTAGSLSTAMRECRMLLPRGHRVRALVAVHRTGSGDYELPTATRDLRWVLADEVGSDLRRLLAPYGSTVSRHTIAALTEVRRA